MAVLPNSTVRFQSRREFLASLGWGGVALAAPVRLAQDSQDRLPLVLRNGRAFIEGQWTGIDIGVDEQGRIRLGSPGLEGRRVLDVSGRVVCPGFIDVLADGTTSAGRAYRIFEQYKLADGVTTVLQMHGGSEDAGLFYSTHEPLPHRTNYGVSTKVMGIRNRYASLKDRLKQAQKCLEEGALGVSHSLEYQPTPHSEMLEFARLASRYSRPLFLHLRHSSQERELDGVEEAVRLAEETGTQVHIAHLHSTGGTFNMEGALEKIQKGASAGLRITTGVYPYTYWATYLSSRRFGPGWQERYGLDYHDLVIVGTGEVLTKQAFEHYRKVPGVLVAVPPGSMTPERTIDLALRQDFCLVESDGGILSEPRANNHPRGAGCFATALRHGLSISIPLEKMLEKLTSLPRDVIGQPLADRGILAEGAKADLTVFDPETVDGTATIDNPNQFSKGIEAAIVNGELAYLKGEILAEAGSAVRAGLGFGAVAG